MDLRPLAFPLLLCVAGCGGGGGDRGATVQPLTPVGSVEIVRGAEFNGQPEPVALIGPTAEFESSALVVDALYDNDSDPAVDRQVQITLSDFADRKGKRFILGQPGVHTLVFRQLDGGETRTWRATGGTVDLGGREYGWRVFRFQNVTIEPVPGTGATGTATLSGRLQVSIATPNP